MPVDRRRPSPMLLGPFFRHDGAFYCSDPIGRRAPQKSAGSARQTAAGANPQRHRPGLSGCERMLTESISDHRMRQADDRYNTTTRCDSPDGRCDPPEMFDGRARSPLNIHPELPPSIYNPLRQRSKKDTRGLRQLFERIVSLV